jgi:alpha-ketoglutarate-dependent taurine dioxygenase
MGRNAGSAAQIAPEPAERSLPLIVRPDDEDGALWRSDPPGWRRRLRQRVLDHGAVLFRGFPVDSPAAFESFAAALSPPDPWAPYREEAVLRIPLGGHVFTSSEYHPSGTIFPHNEKSQCQAWPLRLFFTCQQPAQSGGATPLTAIRSVTRRLDPDLAAEFRAKGVLYERNFNADFGLALEAAFGSQDRAEVERYCRDNDIAWEWRGAEKLRIRFVRPAFALHPHTGEELFFNLAAFYHPSTLERRFRLAMRGVPADELPFNSFYGDGSAIPDDVLERCRAAYAAATQRFEWAAGDVAMIDNMLVAHGREAFQGPRRVWIAMTEETSRRTPVGAPRGG